MKWDKEEKARREGMSYALKIAKESGVDGLENELKFRGATNVPISVSRNAINEAARTVKDTTIDVITFLSLVTLREEFKFGEKRLQRFMDKIEEKSELLNEDFNTWKEKLEALEDETGIHLTDINLERK